MKNDIAALKIYQIFLTLADVILQEVSKMVKITILSLFLQRLSVLYRL